MSRRSRLLVALGAMASLALLVALGAILLVRSSWFAEQVRGRIVAEAERITGGKAQLGSFRFDWTRLEARFEALELRGAEPEIGPPLFRARSAVIGLRIVSFLRRDIDIALLALEEPEVLIQFDEQGRINLPRLPETSSGGDPLEPFLKLAIRRLELRRGSLLFEDRRVPLDFAARNLRLDTIYQPRPARYLGTLRLEAFELAKPVSLPLALDSSEVAWIAESNRLQIGRLRVRSGSSTVEVAGAIESFRPFEARFEYAGSASVAELARPLGLPLLPAGNANFNGRFSFASGRYLIQARAEAAGLAFAREGIRVDGIGAHANLEATPERISARDLEVRALRGAFRGEAALHQGGIIEVRGSLRSLPLEQVTARLRRAALPWTGLISGAVSLRGRLNAPGAPDLIAGVKLTIAPAGERPLEGALEMTYGHRGRALRFGNSFLNTGSTRVEFSGALGEKLKLALASKDLDELLPAARLFSEEVPASLPARLAGGEVRFEGQLAGRFEQPHLRGWITAGPLEYEGHRIGHLAVELDLEPARLSLRNLALRRDRAQLKGDVSVGLSQWRPVRESRLGGHLTVTGFSLEEALREAGQQLPVAGTLSAAAKLDGTVAEPQVLARVHVGELRAYGERFDGLEAEVRYGKAAVEIVSGRLRAGASTAGFSGVYRLQRGDWRRGELEFTTNGSAFRLSQFQAVRGFRPGLDGTLGWRAHGAVEFGSQPRLIALLGEAYVRQLSLEDKPLGNLRLEAASRDELLQVRGEASFMTARLAAAAEWSLVGESFGLGEVRFSGLTLGALAELGLLGERDRELPVEGSLDGEVAFTGPVLRPAAWRGMARVSRFELTPTAGVDPARREELTLRNAGPLLFAINPGGIQIQQARLVAKGTDLAASGTLSFPRRNPWNLLIDGSLDLAGLSAFEPGLIAEGRSELSITVRGSLLEPQLFGRLRFQKASFFVKDFPNGLEQASGAILFDRNRATIEQLRAQTGGGDVALSGFVAFGGEELVYRLQMEAKRVRLRYPAEVSTVLDARLEFTGSSTRSLLSGEVSVQRATFLTGTDIGGILSETARPATRPAVTSPFLRGMAFDIAIVTAGEAEFSTSLTRDIEVEANLRLRGGPARPVLLGRVAVNQGEIIFFGNRYTISQGEITFFNPAKIEPVLALDLETKVRGYTVMINFSGPLDQLNFTYRSDPPLQSQEILALLTVGRTPEATRAPGGGAATSQSFLQAGGNSLLGQALATPVSSRLQRFFGVSRLKIDPQLTGVDNTPETYVTIEQQISREITLTYVTNLARTQQQIVRIEWNLSRDWSVNAVRDSNGVFGIDFVYRRRF